MWFPIWRYGPTFPYPCMASCFIINKKFFLNIFRTCTAAMQSKKISRAAPQRLVVRCSRLLAMYKQVNKNILRELLAYRIDQWWCKKHGNKSDRNIEIGLYLAHYSGMCVVLCAKYRPISIFLSLLFPCFLHHHWSILYANNSLVRECFYLLVS